LFEFTPLDGAPVEHLGPGTHIDLELRDDCIRQYSLAALRSDAYVVAVQCDVAGRGGSVHLHERARVGDRFRVADARNHFPLDETAHHTVLIAGGIGITPILPMLERLDALNASWELHYAARTGPVPFESRLRRFGHRVTTAVRDAPGYRRLEIQTLVDEAPEGSTFYCCGPEAMLSGFASATAGLPEARVHVEHFAPAAPLATDGGFVVSLAKLGREIAVRPRQTILEALLDAGIDAPHSCQQGICGACETSVLSGLPDHRDGILSPSERAANNTMMICCSGSLGPRLVLDR
jgi:vanillate O-demethylase ferredoxin subunit